MPTPPHGLTERDVSYLKLLKTLKQLPTVSEGTLGVVRRLAAWMDSVAVLEFIAGHQPWYDDWEVKESLVHNDLLAQRWRSDIEKAIAIFDLLREMDDPVLSAQERGEIQDDIKYLFKTLAEHDRAVVKQHAYQLSASRQGKTGPGVGVATPSSAAAVAPDPAGAANDAAAVAASQAAEEALQGDVTQTIRDAELEARQIAEAVASEELAEAVAEIEEAPAPTTATLAAIPLDRRLTFAQASPDPAVLGLLVFDTNEDVLIALLDNPALGDRQAATIARRATARVAEAIYRHRRIFMRPLVREALLECPSAPSSALLEVVNSISDLIQLLKLIKSPKIKFMEVKAKARSRLAMMFKSLGMSEKISAIRRAGSSLLKELWTDFFRDEALVAQCVAEKSLDPSIILEIARSKIAPRRALELIAANASYVANYQICLELVMNPKTPRQVVTKLLPKLNANDRKMIKNNPALPEAIRRFA